MSSPEASAPQSTPPSATARAPRKIGTQDPAHVMDFAPLHLGHPPASKRIVNMVDLEVQVFGMDEIANSTLPIAVIILAHGFANRASQMEPMAAGLIGEAGRLERTSGRRRTRDVLVVTLDQRNHGARRRVRGTPVFNEDPMRLVHMATAVSGGRQDHQLIITHLASYLFPTSSRTVVEYMSAGVSLGGHITWRLLREDPRIRIGVPIITIPSEAQGASLTKRVTALPVAESYLPPSIQAYFFDKDEGEVYKGKKVLSIHGGEDALIPVGDCLGAWEGIERQAEWEGEMEMYVQEGRGHVVTQEMVGRAGEWFWRWGLSEAA